jgi:soluble lytic murein transglycosylase-like protein
MHHNEPSSSHFHRRHPTGRARRRWPRAYDGGHIEPNVNPRYRRDREEDLVVERRRTGRRSMMQELRENPLKNGLIGLAVVGTAAPIAINRYQQALRTDPTHEQTFTMMEEAEPAATEDMVADVLLGMEEERTETVSQREAVIAQKMDEYAAFKLSRSLAEQIYDMAESAEVDIDVAFGLVAAESSFRNSATSRVGAVGLTQLMPATARWLEPGISQTQLRDSGTNLRIGFGYLKQLIDKYGGNEDLALVAYNRGPGTVDRILKRGGDPDNGYASFVRTGIKGNHRG